MGKPGLALKNVPPVADVPTEYDEVDASAVEMMIADASVGARIKQLRLKRSMGLVELGDLTGLSASFLSQLETGRVVPTLRNLARLSLAFHKDISYFFQPDRHGFFRIQRKKDRVRIPQPKAANPSYVSESFGILVRDRSLSPCLAEFYPHRGESPFRPHLYHGHELIYVVSGSILIQSGERHEVLRPGDAVYMDANATRTIQCTDNEPAAALILGIPTRN